MSNIKSTLKAEEVNPTETSGIEDHVQMFGDLTISIFEKTVRLIGESEAQDNYGQLWAFSQLLSQAPRPIAIELLTTIWESMEYYEGGHHRADVGGLAIGILGDARMTVSLGGPVEAMIPKLRRNEQQLVELRTASPDAIKAQLVPVEFLGGTIPTRGSFG